MKRNKKRIEQLIKIIRREQQEIDKVRQKLVKVGKKWVSIYDNRKRYVGRISRKKFEKWVREGVISLTEKTYYRKKNNAELKKVIGHPKEVRGTVRDSRGNVRRVVFLLYTPEQKQAYSELIYQHNVALSRNMIIKMHVSKFFYPVA